MAALDSPLNKVGLLQVPHTKSTYYTISLNTYTIGIHTHREKRTHRSQFQVPYPKDL